jgi:enoyl-CoA hydratase/carnithine racemase
MAEPPVLLERSGAVAEVILNRPERRNAVTGPLADALRETFVSLAGDDSVGAIVLRGAGGAFCSGLDLKEFNADPPPSWTAGFQEAWIGAHAAIFDCPKVVVGAVERFAINGGAALALACDLVVVGRESFLQVGEIQQGVGAPMNLAWLALRHSEAVAARLALTGERVFGEELVRLGVALRCVEDGEVLAEAGALASRMADYPLAGAAATKRILRTLSPGVRGEEWFTRAAAASGRRSGSGGLRAVQER